MDWNIVFESWNYKNDWDGKGKGNSLPSGPYYYIIDRGDETEVVERAGCTIFN